jgi:hypothetical protein
VTTWFDHQHQGYRDGVIIVDVPCDGFWSSVISMHDGDVTRSYVEARRDGEDPRVFTVVTGRWKQPAKTVGIVLYRADVLEEDNDRETDADWEIISINASPSDVETPMHALTMARNERHLAGGTSGSYSKNEYIDAILFWSNHGMADPEAMPSSVQE